MPAQAAISHDTIVSAREEDSNPPRLGRGTRGAIAPIAQTRSAICIAAGAANTRGSTEARDHFIYALVVERIGHPSSKRDEAGDESFPR